MSAFATTLPISKPRRSSAVTTTGVPFSYRAALFIFFAGSGFIPAINYINLRWSLGIPEFITARATLLVCLPAIVIGTRLYSRHGAFAKSSPLLLLLGWILITLTWVDPTERGRGLICVTTIIFALPLSAFIRATNWFRQGAICFATSFLTGMTAVQLSAPNFVGRWGDFAVGDQVVMNSNQIGFIAAMTSLLMYATWHESPSRMTSPLRLRCLLPAGLGIAAYAIAMLTVSRSACGSLVLASLGALSYHMRRSLVTLLATPVIILLSLYIMVASGVADQWADRLADSDTSTLNGRTEIWDAIGAVRRRLGLNCIWGLGFGGIDKVLGEELGGVTHPIDGIQRTHSHNMYLEWSVELGIVGVLLALHLAIMMISIAMTLDRQHGAPWRSLMLLTMALIGLASVPTKVTCFPAFGALVLSTLSSSISPTRVKAYRLATTDRSAVLRKNARSI